MEGNGSAIIRDQEGEGGKRNHDVLEASFIQATRKSCFLLPPSRVALDGEATVESLPGTRLESHDLTATGIGH
jgi:hypothetical protein